MVFVAFISKCKLNAPKQNEVSIRNYAEFFCLEKLRLCSSQHIYVYFSEYGSIKPISVNSNLLLITSIYGWYVRSKFANNYLLQTIHNGLFQKYFKEVISFELRRNGYHHQAVTGGHQFRGNIRSI